MVKPKRLGFFKAKEMYDLTVGFTSALGYLVNAARIYNNYHQNNKNNKNNKNKEVVDFITSLFVKSTGFWTRKSKKAFRYFLKEVSVFVSK
jgi:hypothetical protein